MDIKEKIKKYTYRSKWRVEEEFIRVPFGCYIKMIGHKMAVIVLKDGKNINFDKEEYKKYLSTFEGKSIVDSIDKVFVTLAPIIVSENLDLFYKRESHLLKVTIDDKVISSLETIEDSWKSIEQFKNDTVVFDYK